jgi:hypothetical protein
LIAGRAKRKTCGSTCFNSPSTAGYSDDRSLYPSREFLALHARPAGPVGDRHIGSWSYPPLADHATGGQITGTRPPRPLAPRLPRRPWSAAYGPGPSVFMPRAAKCARATPRFPSPPLAGGPRRSRPCRSGPAGAGTQEGSSLAGPGVAEAGRPSDRRRISPPLSHS